MTATYALGSYSILIRRVLVGGDIGPGPDPTRLWIGLGLLLFLLLAFCLISLNRQKAYEGHGKEVVQDPKTPGALRTLTEESDKELFASLLDVDDKIETAAFWSHSKSAKRMLTLHTMFAGSLIIVLHFFSWTALKSGDPIDLERPFIWLGLIEIGLLFLLAVASLGFRNWSNNFATGRFRALGMVVAPTIGFVASSGLFSLLASGVERIFKDRLSRCATNDAIGNTASQGCEGIAEVSSILPDLGLAFQWALFGLLVSLFWLVGLMLLEALNSDVLQRPVVAAPPGAEPTGFTSKGKRRRCARSRSFSEFGRRLDWVLTVTAAVFYVVSTLIMLDTLNIGPLQGIDRFTLLPQFGSVGIGSAGLLASAGPWVSNQILGIIRGGHRKPATRRKIGIVWDVLGFWPRRFHPFAVRPYAERAVPELLGRFGQHVVVGGRRLLLSTHSQGTVLGFAALARIVKWDEERRLASNESPVQPIPYGREVAFLTYGSPLSQLHGRFFPAYFNTEAFDAVAYGLKEGSIAFGGGSHPIGWRNFFRRTDYIGKQVLVGYPDYLPDYLKADLGQSDIRNQVVDDPSEDPLMSELPREQPWDSYPDPMRRPWADLAKHSYYNDELVIKDWVKAVKERLRS